MIYIFDDNSLSNILNHYYPARFPTFWEKFDKMVEDGNIISIREVRYELTQKFDDGAIDRLSKFNKDFFVTPSSQELAFITEIYSVAHFRQNLERKKLLQGGYFADPMIIAKAKIENGTVITEEVFKAHAAKIPNICEHFEILCDNFEGFLTKEDWIF